MIKDIQKATLIDYPGKIACTFFFFGCNWRCQYCHNPSLVCSPSKEHISEDEALLFLKSRQGLLDGVCISGGEPTLSVKKSFLRKIRHMGFSIKLDTNGTNPTFLQEVLEEGLIDYVAMDIKASTAKYNDLTQSSVSIEKIKESMKLLPLFPEYEFRTTMIHGYHSLKEMEEIADFIHSIVPNARYFLQAYIPREKMVGEHFQYKEETSKEELLTVKKAIQHHFSLCEVR